MDTEAQERIECPACGTGQLMWVVRAASVGRTPEVKAALLDGRFMRHRCEACAQVLEIERDLLWTDFDAGWFILCYASDAAVDVDACEEEAIEVFRTTAEQGCPPVVRALGERLSLRVVFGYDQLREKVLCREHGLDDKVVEFVKLAVLAARPEWQRPGFDGLRLVDVLPEGLAFEHDADGPKPRVVIDRDTYTSIAADPRHFIDWAPQIWQGPYVNARSVRMPVGAVGPSTP